MGTSTEVVVLASGSFSIDTCNTPVVNRYLVILRYEIVKILCWRKWGTLIWYILCYRELKIHRGHFWRIYCVTISIIMYQESFFYNYLDFRFYPYIITTSPFSGRPPICSCIGFELDQYWCWSFWMDGWKMANVNWT